MGTRLAAPSIRFHSWTRPDLTRFFYSRWGICFRGTPNRPRQFAQKWLHWWHLMPAVALSTLATVSWFFVAVLQALYNVQQNDL